MQRQEDPKGKARVKLENGESKEEELVCAQVATGVACSIPVRAPPNTQPPRCIASHVFPMHTVVLVIWGDEEEEDFRAEKLRPKNMPLISDESLFTPPSCPCPLSTSLPSCP